MNSVENALWFIENHFATDITLDDVARVAGISRYHLSHVFGMATGRSVMGYVRGRRLSEAACTLSNGAPDILSVALDAGHGSHEAFTRAFRDLFGLTPEQVRANRSLANLTLMEAVRMDSSIAVELEPPRFAEEKALLIAGLSGRYTFQTNAGIPAQWQRFTPYIGNLPGQAGPVTYGVSWNFDDEGNFEYVAGVAVERFSGLPPELARVHIAPHRYAVFTHRAHISAISATHYTIWSKWVPESGSEPAEALNFERYDERFDPRTGNGPVEIWIPIKAPAKT